MEETEVVAENGGEEEDDGITGAEEARVNNTEKVVRAKKKIDNTKKEVIIRTTKTELEIKVAKIGSKTASVSNKQIDTR